MEIRQNSYKFPVIPARISEIPGSSRREFWGSAIPCGLLSGATHLPEIFGQPPPVERNSRFWTNNRSYSASAVTPSEKSSINTNSKSPMRFPTSLGWSSYVAPKSPKWGLKNTKRPISVQNHTSLEESLLQKSTKFLCVKTVSDKVVRHSLA